MNYSVVYNCVRNANNLARASSYYLETSMVVFLNWENMKGLVTRQIINQQH